MKPSVRKSWKMYVANALTRISKEDSVLGLAYVAFHAGLTEEDVVAATKRRSTIPDSLKVELQNKFRDVSRKVKS